MAGISTAIEVQDRVSGALNRITASLYNTTSAFYDVDRASETTFNASGVQSMTQEFYAYEERIQQIESELVGANRRIQQMEEHTRRASQVVNTLGKVFMGVASAFGLNQIIQTSDELVQTTSRINMMNDGLQTTSELMNMIYHSAQNARGGFSEMADVVARFGNNAGDAFGSSEEIVSFAELVQKQMTIAGASTSEASNAMLQLSQGLGSGVLRGDELNSIFEQAPNLIQNIADYLDVSIGEIRNMASEGQLTADIVKNAIFSASDEINSKFNEMPMTWGQVWQSIQNTALMKFQPVLNRISEFANSDKFQGIVNGVTSSMAIVANMVLNIFDLVGAVGTFVYDNWSIISPIVYGVVAALALYATYLGITNSIELISKGIKIASCIASYAHAAATGTEVSATAAATAAQYGFNTALLACPLTWIILIIIAAIAAIYGIVAAINHMTGSTISATGVIVGALTAAVSVVWNLFLTLVSLIIQNALLPLTTAWDTFANFFGNIFNDPVATIIRTFENLANTVLGILQTIANGIDAIFGSNLSGAVEGWMGKVSGKADELVNKYGNGTYEEKSNMSGQLQDLLSNVQTKFSWQTSDAFNTGYSWGEGIEESVSSAFSGFDMSGMSAGAGAGGSFDMGQMPSNIAETAGNTGAMADSMDISSENLKYLRDIAERDVVNRFTTAEIKVDMNNNNNINNGMDIDGIVRTLAEGVQEAMTYAAEGVHA